MASSSEVEAALERGPADAAVQQFLLFSLCQLRAQAWEFKFGEAWDAELRQLDTAGHGADVFAEAAAMEKFRAHRAKGDKWVPFHTAAGVHERYIAERLYTMSFLTEQEKYMLHFVFRGSSCPPLFDELYLPLFTHPDAGVEGSEAQGRWKQLFYQPDVFFARDGFMHRQMLAYRQEGNALHTTAYIARPGKGQSADEYVWFIVAQTHHFLEIGRAAWTNVGAALAAGTTLALEKLRDLFLGFHRIGPTTAKMFLVSTHLLYPQLHLLRHSCVVGDGAAPAFIALFPALQRSQVIAARDSHRERLLTSLFRNLTAEEVDPRERRMAPMLRWTTVRMREVFAGIVKPEAVPDRFEIHELQVQLCEWRKFVAANTRKKRKANPADLGSRDTFKAAAVGSSPADPKADTTGVHQHAALLDVLV